MYKYILSGGRGGIRTPGTSRFNGFQDRRNRPLCHPSGGDRHNAASPDGPVVRSRSGGRRRRFPSPRAFSRLREAADQPICAGRQHDHADRTTIAPPRAGQPVPDRCRCDDPRDHRMCRDRSGRGSVQNPCPGESTAAGAARCARSRPAGHYRSVHASGPRGVLCRRPRTVGRGANLVGWRSDASLCTRWVFSIIRASSIGTSLPTT